MIEVADVFRRFAADYLSAHGASMLPSHRRAIENILDCRTAALGGQVWRCDACGTEVFSFHSCGNRSCPKCHTAQTQEWLEHRQAEMLPVPYFHITVTVPAELREVLRANQRDGYAVLMQASAAAIIELARDPRYVGGTVAVLAVLHTWTQQLNLHPHVHCLVSGGGISEDGKTGIRHAGSSSYPSRLSSSWCAASSGRYYGGSAPISSSPTRRGACLGSFTSPPGATVKRPCSNTSPATSFASLSPTPASSVSTTKRSPSNTRNARPAACEPAASAARNSCAASSSTCCRAASTRSAISACGIQRSATTPLGCGRCCNSSRHPSSIRRRTPSFRHLCRPTQSRCRRSSR